jgi:diguanylate cyclase (GGDEF)-like protein/PAS domain S-box-containing protein
MTETGTDIETRTRADHRPSPDEGLFRRAFVHVPNGLSIEDAMGRFLRVNPAFCALLGYSEHELLERDFLSILEPDELPAIYAAMAEFSSGERSIWRGEVRVVRADGATVWVAGTASVLRDDAGDAEGYVFQVEDISERRRAQAELERRVAEQAAVAGLGARALAGAELSELMHAAVDVVHAHLGCDYVGITELLPGGEQMLLRAGIGMPEQHVGTLRLPVAGSQTGYALHQGAPVVVEDLREESRFDSKHATAGGVRSGVCAPVEGVGALWAQTTTERAFSSHDTGFVQSVANVVAQAVQRRRVEDDARHRALHDALTGLPNRVLFRDRLEHALAQSARRRSTTAVLFLDVDNFKVINDTAGHSLGDELLIAVAQRLRAVLRSADTLARLGGDEFGMLCEEVADAADAVAVAERLMDALASPFALSGGEHTVSASIGIALADGLETEAEAMLRDADAAMYRAKERGRARYELFDEALRERALRRVRVEHALRGAIENDQLWLAYQPLVSLADGRIESAEALLRLTDPELGSVSPMEFIPIAEQSGLILSLGAWVLDQACQQAAGWPTGTDGRPIAVSINVSAHQLVQPEFPDAVRLALDRTGLPASRLILELTETALISTTDSPVGTLDALRALGVRVVLDDFGTGYSSLSYLERFPLDGLKLDRGFVAGLERNDRARAIFAAAVDMAAALELPVVAEGVETERHATIVGQLGCTFAQGYHYAAPMPAHEFQQLLETQSRAAWHTAA